MEHVLFFHVLGMIIPIDLHYFSEGLEPPTRHPLMGNIAYHDDTGGPKVASGCCRLPKSAMKKMLNAGNQTGWFIKESVNQYNIVQSI